MTPFGLRRDQRVAGRRSIPFQRSLLPFVDEADGQHAEEHHHRPEAEHADLAEGHRPGKQEGDFEVEDDEQDRRPGRSGRRTSCARRRRR